LMLLMLLLLLLSLVLGPSSGFPIIEGKCQSQKYDENLLNQSVVGLAHRNFESSLY
jgi:hypothetical protein